MALLWVCTVIDVEGVIYRSLSGGLRLRLAGERRGKELAEIYL